MLMRESKTYLEACRDTGHKAWCSHSVHEALERSQNLLIWAVHFTKQTDQVENSEVIIMSKSIVNLSYKDGSEALG